MKRFFCILLTAYCILPTAHCQPADTAAWALIEAFEQSNPQGSPYFEHLDTHNFIDNIKRRLTAPDKFCQGFGTTFCGPSVLLVNNLIAPQPAKYVQLLLDLYQHGETVYFNGRDSIHVAPDEMTRSFVGRLMNRELEIKTREEKKGAQYAGNSELLSDNHADQMIILCVKYRYSGLFGKNKFREGDADRTLGFGSTIFTQFKSMNRDFFGLQHISKGASLHNFLPSPKRVWADLSTACAEGKAVYLMVDADYFRELTELVLWGSHYVHLYDFRDNGDTVDLEIWDYGYRRWLRDYKKTRFYNALTGYLIVSPTSGQSRQ